MDPARDLCGRLIWITLGERVAPTVALDPEIVVQGHQASDSGSASAVALEKGIEMRSTNLYSDELTCPSCIAKIESRLRRLPGVDDATVHFETGRIAVRHDTERASVQDLIEAVAQAGYRAVRRGFAA